MRELFILLIGGFFGFINGVFLTCCIQLGKEGEDYERKNKKNK